MAQLFGPTTEKDTKIALRVLREIHAIRHSPTDIFKSSCEDCGCAFGIVYRMIQDHTKNSGTRQ